MGKDQEDLSLNLEANAAHVDRHHSHDEKNAAVGALEVELNSTVKDVVENHPALIWWCFYWAMCAVGWGFDAQISGAMISVASFRRDFGYVLDGEAILPASWQTAFNMITSVGQFFGGFVCSWMADRVGRKWSLCMGLVVLTGGTVGAILSVTRPAFLGAKLIIGLGLGFLLTLSPLACSEVAPVALRGVATAGVNLGIAVGQLLSNGVVAGFGDRDDRWAYRGPFATQLFFCAFLAIGLIFAPETPYYLVRKGRSDQATKSLRALYGPKVDVEGKLAALEMTIQEERRTSTDSEKNATWMSCFRGTNRIRSAISVGAFLCQHAVGIVFVLGYSTYFFQLAGLQVAQSFNLGVGVTACGVAGNIISWFVVDSFGRRKVFLSGMSILAALLLLIGIMDVVPTGPAKWVQASATVLYAFFYFMTVGAMAFVLLGEVSSVTLRAKTTALATATQAVAGTVVNLVVPYLVNPDEANLKGKVGFIFGGLAVLASIASWVYVPELKGKSFDQIDRLFAAKVPPRKMGDMTL